MAPIDQGRKEHDAFISWRLQAYPFHLARVLSSFNRVELAFPSLS